MPARYSRMLASGLLTCGLLTLGAATAWGASTQVKVVVSGGYATDSRDGGRPIILVASGLGVPAPVFRTAFSGVTPAPGGAEPDPAQVQLNKAALLRVLAPYGVTNERLDTVSNYYRYLQSAGQTWTHVAAAATATVRNGKIVSVKLTRAGAGYSSVPTFRVAGHPEVRLVATVAYGTDLATNGRVASLRLARSS
jgi:hypothetical protein